MDSDGPQDTERVQGGLTLELGSVQTCEDPAQAAWSRGDALGRNDHAGPDGGSAVVEDIDGDGDLDIIATWDLDTVLHVWRNTDDGFVEERVFAQEPWQLSRVPEGWVSGGPRPTRYDLEFNVLGTLDAPEKGVVREAAWVEGVGLLLALTSPDGPQHQVDFVVDGEPLEDEGLASQHAFDILVFDHDGDGDQDAYIVNDDPQSGRNVLWHQEDGRLVATDIAPLRMSGMGGDVADLNGDGLPDLYLSAAARNVLLVANPDRTYTDVTFSWHAEVLIGQGSMAWGSVFWDADNDGDLDLMVAEGDFGGDHNLGLGPQPLSLQVNQGSEFLGEVWDEGYFRGVVPIDMNDDGVLDLVVSSAFDGPRLWLSEGCTENSWLRVEGPTGARVEVTTDAGTQTFWISSDSGFGSAKRAQAHIGTGSATTASVRSASMTSGSRRPSIHDAW